jgi:hypothetical protein
VWEMMVLNEKAAETIRERLNKNVNFNLKLAFNQCDFAQDGYLSISEVIISFLMFAFRLNNKCMSMGFILVTRISIFYSTALTKIKMEEYPSKK